MTIIIIFSILFFHLGVLFVYYYTETGELRVKGRSRKKKKRSMSFLTKKSKLKRRRKQKSPFLSKFIKPKPRVKGRSRRRVKKKRFVTARIAVASMVCILLIGKFKDFYQSNAYADVSIDNFGKDLSGSEFQEILNQYGLECATPSNATSCNATPNNSTREGEVVEESNVVESSEVLIQPIGPGYENINAEEILESSTELESSEVLVQSIGPGYETNAEETLESSTELESSEVLVQSIGPGYETNAEETLESSTELESSEVLAQPIGPGYVNSIEESKALDSTMIQPIGPGIATPVENNTENVINDVAFLKESIVNYCHFNEADYQKFVGCIIQNLQSHGIEMDEQKVLNMWYQLSQVSNDEKLAFVLNYYGVSHPEFLKVAAACCAEAVTTGNNYIDTYAVANTVFNRANDAGYSRSGNIYAQMVKPGQFEVFRRGMVDPLVGRTDLIGYQAVLDALYSRITIHDFVNFCAPSSSKKGGVQFTSKGNVHRTTMNAVVSKEAIYQEIFGVPEVEEEINLEESQDYQRVLVP